MPSTRYSCPILIKLEFSPQILEKYSNIKLYENPSGGSRVVPCGQMDRRTDMMELVVAFRNFANAPYNSIRTSQRTSVSVMKNKRTNVNVVYISS